MRKLAVFILAILMAAMCGCSSFLEKEYFTVSEYDASSELAGTADNSSIGSYSDLVTALNAMVSAHQDMAQLQFSNYAGNVSDDLAEACWHIKTNTALGAYLVDYVSYDISRIVTYYQANVYINYLRTAEEMAEIKSIGINMVGDTAVDAVSSGEDELVIQLYTSTIDGDAMGARVETALLEESARIPVIPQIDVDVYSGENYQNIFDIHFDYGHTADEISDMLTDMQSAINSAAALVRRDDAYSVAVLAAGMIADTCSYDGSSGGTAYDALVLRSGGSRALAMALDAVCEAKGVEALVVTGLSSNAEHYWNLVRIDDNWYHIDVTEAISSGSAALRTDSEMSSRYRWDELDYPECSGPSLLPSQDAGAQ